ncbi:MAG: hypothetical protein IKE81_09105 [Clostridia bacterium]|nr:hypothetical protein [Clostridia bacterium]
MRYLPCWKQIGISPSRYSELLHFCRQYPEWKKEASSLLGIRAVKADGLPHGNGKSDPVAAAAEKREKLLEKIAIVDECAKAVDGGDWYASIIQNVCIAKSYEQMDRALMPTSNKNAFFKKRAEFFKLLDERKA